MNAWTPYCGPGVGPAELPARWNFDPVLLAVLAAGVLTLLWLRPGTHRGWLTAALAVLLLSFVSPLCAWSSSLFGARTVHHLLLIAAAAPLLARALDFRLGGVAAATPVQAAAFWLWHAPGAYAWALSNDLAYWLMQGSVLATAVWFWSAVRNASAPSAIAGLVMTTVQMGLLGALLALADQPLYAPHLLTTAAWGLTPLEDQQIAGLLMWAPALGLYLAMALAKLARLMEPPRPAPAAP